MAPVEKLSDFFHIYIHYKEAWKVSYTCNVYFAGFSRRRVRNFSRRDVEWLGRENTTVIGMG